MRLAMTPTARYAVQRCPDALSNVQLRLLSLADGSRDVEAILRECTPAQRDDAQQALGILLELELLAPLARMRDTRAIRKRSAAGSKMYLLAIFDRLRSPRAARMRKRLLATRSEFDLMEAIADVMPFLEAHTSAAFATHVMAELQQLLPERHTDAIDRLMARTLREHRSLGETPGRLASGVVRRPSERNDQ